MEPRVQFLFWTSLPTSTAATLQYHTCLWALAELPIALDIIAGQSDRVSDKIQVRDLGNRYAHSLVSPGPSKTIKSLSLTKVTAAFPIAAGTMKSRALLAEKPNACWNTFNSCSILAGARSIEAVVCLKLTSLKLVSFLNTRQERVRNPVPIVVLMSDP